MATSGTPVLFDNGRNAWGATCRLSDNKYAIGYRTYPSPDRCRVVICDRTGVEVSVGSGYNIVDGTGWWMDMDTLPSGELWPSGDADRVYVYTKDIDGAEVGAGCGIHKCGSVSGQTISWGTAREWYPSSNQNSMSVSALSSEHVGCTYRYLAGNRMRCFSSVVAGDNSITVGSERLVEGTSDVTYNQTQIIDPVNKLAVMTYRHLVGGVWYGKARIIDYDVNPPGTSSSFIFHTGGSTTYAYGLRICPLSAGKFVLGYSTNGGPARGCMVVGEVSGTTMTFGSPYNFSDSNSIPYISQQRIGDDKFVFTFSDQSNSGKGAWMVGEVSGTVITYTQSGIFCDDQIHNETMGGAQCTALTDDVIAITYNKYDSLNGYTMILDLGDGAPSETEFAASGNLVMSPGGHQVFASSFRTPYNWKYRGLPNG